MFKRTLFGKIFIVIFLAIFLLLSLFAFNAYRLQKISLLNSLESEAKTMADAITFVNTDAFIMNDEIAILEFIFDFVQKQKQLKTFIISKKDSKSVIVKKNSWEVVENIPLYKDYESDKKNSIIHKSSISHKEVFYYNYPVLISGVTWGWLHLELSLDGYNKKLEIMYSQFQYLALIMFLGSIFISFIIARMFSKPIVKLNDTSQKVANGELSLRVNISSKDEIGTLAKSFNTMVENLENSQYELKMSHDDLEDRVAKRTKELNHVNQKLEYKSKQLKELNDNLEHKVQEEILKQQEQERLLIQQSRLAAMGEMIGNIAHQWRQPLNSLGLVIQNIDFTYKMGDLDDEFMNKSIIKANMLTTSMSKTIDDFRNFFKPNKEKVVIDIDDILEKSVALIEISFEYSNIKIIYNHVENIKIYGFENEFSQVILNILSNAKDALKERNSENAYVSIEVKTKQKFVYVIIKDNGGGVDEKIADKIFEPYFTTKDEGKGTGIGLYMSKIIIENNMNGKLNFKNNEDGAEFIIKIPIYKEEE